jgi:Peptidase A4 family
MSRFKVAAVGLAGVATMLVAVPTHAGATSLPGNTNLAGYQVLTPTPGAETSVKAQLTVPSATCTTPSQEFASVGVGIGGGAEYFRAGIQGTCGSSGPATYLAYAGGVLSMTVTPGDKVVLSVFTTKSGNPYGWRATVDDLTTGISQSLGSHRSETSTSTYVGLSQPGALTEPVADFGKIQWSKAEFDGSPLGAANPQGFDLYNYPNEARVLALTSPLSPAGSSFTNTWVRSS